MLTGALECLEKNYWRNEMADGEGCGDGTGYAGTIFQGNCVGGGAGLADGSGMKD